MVLPLASGMSHRNDSSREIWRCASSGSASDHHSGLASCSSDSSMSAVVPILSQVANCERFESPMLPWRGGKRGGVRFVAGVDQRTPVHRVDADQFRKEIGALGNLETARAAGRVLAFPA